MNPSGATSRKLNSCRSSTRIRSFRKKYCNLCRSLEWQIGHIFWATEMKSFFNNFSPSELFQNWRSRTPVGANMAKDRPQSGHSTLLPLYFKRCHFCRDHFRMARNRSSVGPESVRLMKRLSSSIMFRLVLTLTCNGVYHLAKISAMVNATDITLQDT